MFSTKLSYDSRESRQRYIADKYAPLFEKNVLDVGADEGYIANYLPKSATYQGIGLGGKNPAIKAVDLEKETLPFDDASIETVMCIEVLEHLENIHKVMDELCRVAKDHVLVSLPNPWADAWQAMTVKPYKQERYTKFYGLPLEREGDRHKWFFSPKEADQFMRHFAEKNGFDVIHYHQELPYDCGLKGVAKRILWQVRGLWLRSAVPLSEIASNGSWWVLKRKS